MGGLHTQGAASQRPSSGPSIFRTLESAVLQQQPCSQLIPNHNEALISLRQLVTHLHAFSQNVPCSSVTQLKCRDECMCCSKCRATLSHWTMACHSPISGRVERQLPVLGIPHAAHQETSTQRPSGPEPCPVQQAGIHGCKAPSPTGQFTPTHSPHECHHAWRPQSCAEICLEGRLQPKNDGTPGEGLLWFTAGPVQDTPSAQDGLAGRDSPSAMQTAVTVSSVLGHDTLISE